MIRVLFFLIFPESMIVLPFMAKTVGFQLRRLNIERLLYSTFWRQHVQEEMPRVPYCFFSAYPSSPLSGVADWSSVRSYYNNPNRQFALIGKSPCKANRTPEFLGTHCPVSLQQSRLYRVNSSIDDHAFLQTKCSRAVCKACRILQPQQVLRQ